MSVCTFLASDCLLPTVSPSQEHPLEINIDNSTIYGGGADDNFYLHIFEDVENYTNKKYTVYLEWYYTNGRANEILKIHQNRFAAYRLHRTLACVVDGLL